MASESLRASGRMAGALGAVDGEDGAQPHPPEVDLPAEGEPPEVVEVDAGRTFAVELGLAEAVPQPAQVAAQAGVAEARESHPGVGPAGAGEHAAAPAERPVVVRRALQVEVE